MPTTDQSYRLAGGPVGFLLIHGLGGTPMEMRYVAQGLAHAGHTVHVPQLAGHCSTADDLGATRWEDWYDTVEQEHICWRPDATPSLSAASRWARSWPSITP